MIRVNLLPIKQARRRSAGRTQLILFGGLIAAELVVLGLLYVIASADLERYSDQVAQFEQDVQTAKEEVKDAEQLKQQKEQLTKQLAVLDQLEQQRSGPVRVLDELQAILSPPRNEEDRFAQLQKNWNVDWDSRRLWIETLKEKEGEFTMSGSAVNHDDVAEFLQRLTTAKHFREVELEIVEAKRSAKGERARTVDFKLHGKISYSGKPVVEEKKGS